MDFDTFLSPDPPEYGPVHIFFEPFLRDAVKKNTTGYFMTSCKKVGR